MAFLSRYSHYSLRLLVYLALHDELVTIGAAAQCYGISRHHLAKIAIHLKHAGYVKTRPGLNGGITLARSANNIVIGHVIRHTESSVNCSLSCTLPDRIMNHARNAFLQYLDQYTLADLVTRHDRSA